MQRRDGFRQVAAREPRKDLDNVLRRLAVWRALVHLTKDRAPEPALQLFALCAGFRGVRSAGARQHRCQRRQHCLVWHPLGQHHLAVVAQDLKPGGQPDHNLVPPLGDVGRGHEQHIAALARGRIAARERDALQDVVGVNLEVRDHRMLGERLLPQRAQLDVLRPEARGQQFEDAELHAGAVQGFEDRAERIGLCLVRQRHHRKVVVVDDENPLLIDAIEGVLERNAFLVRQLARDLAAPCTETAGAALEYRERQQQLFGLDRKVLASLRPLRGGAHMADRVLEVRAVLQLAEVKVVAVLAHAVESLVERGQPLLAVEHEKGVRRAGADRCTLELTHGEHPLGVAHAQDASGRVVVSDRDDQFLSRAWVPHKVALEVGKNRRPIVDLSQELLERTGVGVFEEVHAGSPARASSSLNGKFTLAPLKSGVIPLP